MSDFDFLFSFFGLIAGLTVVEVATRFADAVDAHKRRPMGVLTPLLAVFVLFDVTSFWIAVWSARAVIRVGWGTVFGALAMAVIYFLAAALVFPRGQSDVQDLNEHYWARKRLVISGILLVNVVVVSLEFSRVRPHLTDVWAFFWQVIYFGPLITLWFSRRRSLDIAMLLLLIGGYVVAGLNLLPPGQWAQDVGLANAPAAITTPKSP